MKNENMSCQISVAAGSKEKMRKAGAKAPTAKA